MNFFFFNTLIEGSRTTIINEGFQNDLDQYIKLKISNGNLFNWFHVI